VDQVGGRLAIGACAVEAQLAFDAEIYSVETKGSVLAFTPPMCCPTVGEQPSG
jgi:hypothetical protein